MSKKAATVAVVACLLLAGCAGAGLGSGDSAESADLGKQAAATASGGGGGADASYDAASEGGDGGDGGGDAGGGSDVADAAQQRAIIKTGSMAVEVENFSRARSTIAQRVRSQGGYVGGSDQRLHRSGNETWITGHIVVRVPSDTYEDTQSLAADQGTVLSEETTTKDVTDQLVDLEARLGNLRSRRDRLREFYDQANSTEELLRIEEQLSAVQGQIERLEAQKRSLEQRVAYSTIRIELREPEPGIDQIRTQYHEQSLVAVFVGSVNDIVVFAQASLVTVVGALPWLAVLAVPVVGLYRWLRGRSIPFASGRGSAPATDQAKPAVEETEEQPDDDELADSPSNTEQTE